MNMSHEFTELGLLERENASVLNASLRPLADHLLPKFGEALKGNDCHKPATAGVHMPAFLVISAGFWKTSCLGLAFQRDGAGEVWSGSA